jgi:plastocyanin
VVVAPAYAKTPMLTGEVGPGFSIEVKKAGKDLKTIKAGTYRIKVEDKATIHNFHLSGPGLNKKTGVSFKGETTWTIKLKPGRYTYQCDPHALSGMKGRFRVTA